MPERPTFGRLPGAYFRVVAHLHSDCVGSVAVVFSGFLMRRPLAGAHARRGATDMAPAAAPARSERAAMLLCCWWELAIAGAESALRAGGAEQAVELSAPRPAGRAPSARELSLSVCRHLARACSLCSCIMEKG